jgi:hypothetical protein
MQCVVGNGRRTFPVAADACGVRIEERCGEHSLQHDPNEHTISLHRTWLQRASKDHNL